MFGLLTPGSMRGIGKGQTIHLYVIPEVQNLIEEEIAHSINVTQPPKKRRRILEEPTQQSLTQPLLDVPNWYVYPYFQPASSFSGSCCPVRGLAPCPFAQAGPFVHAWL